MSLDFLEKSQSFRELIEGLRHDRSLNVSGLAEPAIPLFLVCLSRSLRRPVVYVQPQSRPLSRLESQCRFYLDQFSEPPEALTLPALSDDPYEEIFPALEAVSSRMAVLSRLRRRPPRLILTNLPGLLKPVPSPADLENAFLELGPGQRVERDRLLETLAEFGYTREDLIASPGEYAWRGGIVDVFSPWNGFPYRLEFSGDEIVSTREFDPSTQRSLTRQTQLVIPSLREFPATRSFLQDWCRLVESRDGSGAADLTKKTDSLRAGEVFPSFFYSAAALRDRFVPLFHYLPDALFVAAGADEVEAEWEESKRGWEKQEKSLEEKKLFRLPLEEIYPEAPWLEASSKAVRLGYSPSAGEASGFHFPFQPVPRFDNRIPFFIQYVKKILRARDRVYIFLSNATVRQKIAGLLSQSKVPAREEISPFASPRSGEVMLLVGNLEQGFSYGPEKVVYFSERDIFTEEKVLVSRPSRKPFVDHFQDLRASDFVVHADYGIGVFRGLVKLAVDGKSEEFIEISFRDDDRLFVPVEHLDLVQKYSHVGAEPPQLDKLGTLGWQRTKERTKKAIERMATELLDLYARRKATKGFAFGAVGVWESELEKTFEFEETEDQLRAIEDVKTRHGIRVAHGPSGLRRRRLRQNRGRDARRLQGRRWTASRSPCSRPTTVLASQHFKTFGERFAGFPVRSTAALPLPHAGEQQKDRRRTSSTGNVDIVIGTHRLLSEGRRVPRPRPAHRGRGAAVRRRAQGADQAAPQEGRRPDDDRDADPAHAEHVARRAPGHVAHRDPAEGPAGDPDRRRAVRPELITRGHHAASWSAAARFFSCTTASSRSAVAERAGEAGAGGARSSSPTGRWTSASSSESMLDFIERRVRCPARDDDHRERPRHPQRQHHHRQPGRPLRARRSSTSFAAGWADPRAGLRLFARPADGLTPAREGAAQGLEGVQRAGLRIPSRGSRPRDPGGGQPLRREQHGHIEAVGFDYFMELLEQTVNELKGEKVEEAKIEINLRTDIRVPEEYLPQINLRLNLYKRISAADDLAEIDRIRTEIRDRFGPIPPSVESLLGYGAIKHLARLLQVTAVDRVGNRLVLKFLPSSLADVSRIGSVLKRHGGSLTPEGVMTLRLRRESDREVMNETLAALKELSHYHIMS